MTAASFNRPFTEQVAFFRKKLALPSKRWDDIERSAHDRGFIVAGALKADLVSDLQAAVGRAIEEGKSIQWFRQNFDDIVAKHGWTGWTGEGSRGGRAWRTRVIYQTNMATSYAAGRWAQLNDPDLVAMRPYWQYHHADGVLHPRPLHVSWNGLTLPRDHQFWKTHFAPNGWFCHCFITAVSAAMYEAAQAAGRAEPPAGWNAIDPRTGAPIGIDRGFDYAPGANVDTPLRNMVADKLITYPPAITQALSRDLNRYIVAHHSPEDFVTQALADRSVNDQLWLGFAENPLDIEAETGVNVLGYPVLLPAEAPRHAERSHAFDGGDQRPAVAADFARVLDVLNNYDSIRQGDTIAGHQRLVATRSMGEETWRAVYEVRTGKRNRSLALISLVIKR